MVCASSFRATSPTARYCSTTCEGQAKAIRYAGQRPGWGRRELALTRQRRAARGRRGLGGGARWTAGLCAICREPFIALTARGRFCSSRCAYRAQRARNYRNVKRNKKLRVLERDGWRCWLCQGQIDQALLGRRTSAAPSVDHVVPKACGGSDHQDNLRAAHLGCNSRRGVGGLVPRVV
ncbi:MAG: HNH endonuclease [Chloroflexi bacterium]|nr:HNH endonuclease [Chloroflexota bacterium]